MKKYFYFVTFHTIDEGYEGKWGTIPQRNEVELPHTVSSMKEIIIMEDKLMAQGYHCARIVNFQLLRVEG